MLISGRHKAIDKHINDNADHRNTPPASQFQNSLSNAAGVTHVVNAASVTDAITM